MIPQSLAIIFTNHCNFVCDHCSVGDAPNKNNTISESLMLESIEQAYRIPSIRSIVFTGGEATLFIDQLKIGLKHAWSKGFSTRLVSNAWWANTEENALTFVSELASSGLSELNISYDDFHVQYLEKFGGE